MSPVMAAGRKRRCCDPSSALVIAATVESGISFSESVGVDDEICDASCRYQCAVGVGDAHLVCRRAAASMKGRRCGGDQRAFRTAVVSNVQIYADADPTHRAGMDHRCPGANGLRQRSTRAAVQTPQRLGVASDGHGRHDALGRLFRDDDAELFIQRARRDLPEATGHNQSFQRVWDWRGRGCPGQAPCHRFGCPGRICQYY